MKPFAIAYVCVVLCAFIHAASHDVFLTCAEKKWSTMYLNVTYNVQGQFDCVGATDYKVSEVIDVVKQISKISTLIGKFHEYYVQEPNTNEKYIKLYADCDIILREDDELTKLIENKTVTLQNCIAGQLQVGIDRMHDAKQCLDFLPEPPVKT